MVNKDSNVQVDQYLTVCLLTSPWYAQRVRVTKIEFDKGARNGWFTVELPNGDSGLFAGEELIR